MKLKKIEIDAFRVFRTKEDGTFDFTWRKDPSKVANLVAICAPNGFGKTSFYDAVEWCMTNRISRLGRSEELAQAEMEHGSDKAGEKIKQYILKNRYVNKKQGKVKITFEKGKSIENRTRILERRGWNDYFYTPRPKVKKLYFKDVILSQELIDAFLRIDDPKDRYKKFVEYFYDVKDADRLFKNITELIRENELKLNQNADELEKLKNGIESNKVPGDVIEKTNNFIITLKKQDLIDLRKLKALKKGFSASDFNSLTFLVNEFISTLSTPGSGRIFQSQDDENEINKLIAQLPGYSGAKGEKQKLDSAKKEFQKLLVLFGEFKSLKNVIIAQKNEISAFEDERNALQKFKELRPKYIKIQKNIDSKTLEISGCKDRIHKNELKLTGLNSEIKKLERAIKSKNKGLKELKTDRGTIDEMYKAYIKDLDKRNDLSAEVEKNSKELNTHEEKQSRLKQALSILNKLQNEINSGTVNGSKELPEQYIKFYQELEPLQKILKETKENLNNLRKKAESINSLNETHDKIISFGRQYILTTKTTKCPLCGEKDYDDYNKLLAQVESSNVLSELDEDIAGDIKKQEEMICKNQKQYEDILKNFGLKIEKDINTLNKELDELTNTIDKHLKQEKHLIHELYMIDDKIMNYETRFSDKKVEVVKAELDEKITKLEDEIQAKIIELKEPEQGTTEIQNDKIEIEEKIGIEKENISHLQANTDFIHYEELIRVSPLLRKLDPYLADTHIKNLQKKIGKINTDIEANREAIKELENKLQKENEDQVIKDLESTEKRISQKEETIMLYETMLKSHFTAIPQDMENMGAALKAKKEGITAKTTKLEEINNRLNTLKEQFHDLKELINIKKLEEKRSALSDRREDLKYVKTKLEENKEKLQHHIESLVNNFFEKKLINEIYQRIDPHPEYKNIGFNADLSGLTPELNIYLEKEDTVISPNLFLSSAQINVLSLSIFLARALKAKDDRENPIDAIFIDDPIQSMDSINVLSVIDLIRTIIHQHEKQVIVSTHDENFFNLLEKKMPEEYYLSRFIEFETFGKVKTSLD